MRENQPMDMAYMDCPTGAAGDMILAAFLDAGMPLSHLREALGNLDVDGYELVSDTVIKNGMAARNFQVVIEPQHHHRGWEHIKAIIKEGGLTPLCEKRALAVFEKLALAEARAHGVPPEDVHFHEVGAVDSIVDIVGVAIAMEYFHISTLFVSPLPMASGWIRTEHQLVPLPAPATLILLENVPVYGVDLKAELVTPTGAAILTAFAHGFGPWPAMKINRIGVGAGTMDLPERPNVMRLALGSPTAEHQPSGSHGSSSHEHHAHLQGGESHGSDLHHHEKTSEKEFDGEKNHHLRANIKPDLRKVQ